MRIRRTVQSTAALVGLSMVGATLVPATADAQTASVCSMRLHTVTPGGDHQERSVTASKPPVASTPVTGPKDLYPDGKARLAGAFGYAPLGTVGYEKGGYLILGSEMYASGYVTIGDTAELLPNSDGLVKVGGGWGPDYGYFEESRYIEGTSTRSNDYALRDNGELIRWTRWQNRQVSAALPAGMKTMTLISQTRAYETFLATTKAGGLYTIRIPTTSPLKPVVKLVRGSTWQVFETLIAEKCGSQSTLLLGIDKDTHTGYLYAVGHAKGTSTLIQNLGKVSGTLDAAFYARMYLDNSAAGNLFGE